MLLIIFIVTAAAVGLVCFYAFCWCIGMFCKFLFWDVWFLNEKPRR